MVFHNSRNSLAPFGVRSLVGLAAIASLVFVVQPAQGQISVRLIPLPAGHVARPIADVSVNGQFFSVTGRENIFSTRDNSYVFGPGDAVATRVTPPPDYEAFTHYGSSPNGEYLAGLGYDPVFLSGAPQATPYLYSRTSGFTQLSNPAGSDGAATPLSVNSTGTAAAGFARQSPSGSTFPVRWSGTTATPLDLPAGSNVSGIANHMNGSGLITVGAVSTDGVSQATRWSGSSTITRTTLPTPAGFTNASAYRINTGGTAVSGFAWNSSPLTRSSVIWANNTTTVLPDLFGAQVEILAVSDGGLVAVGQANNRAAIWSSTLGMRDLRELASELGLDVSNITFTSATGISFLGLNGSVTIVGRGFVDGVDGHYALTIPSAPTAAATFGAILAFGRRRR